MWATAAAQTSAVPTGPDPQGILESWQFESFENEQVIPRHRYGFLWKWTSIIGWRPEPGAIWAHLLTGAVKAHLLEGAVKHIYYGSWRV